MPTPSFVEFASPCSAGLRDAVGVRVEVVEGSADDDELAELHPVSDIKLSEMAQEI